LRLTTTYNPAPNNRYSAARAPHSPAQPVWRIPSRLAIVGAFGSGKTEVAINCAVGIARSGQPVTLIDLDTVTPALRCRQAAQAMAELPIQLLAPAGQLAYADLPSISAAMRSALADRSRKVILDVGGHPTGARALGSLADLFAATDHAIWGVVSPWRPQTRDPDGIESMMSEISARIGLPVTALVANLHTPGEPNAEVLQAGATVVRQAAAELGITIALYAIDSHHLALARQTLGEEHNWLGMELFMRTPWEEGDLSAGGLWNPPESDAHRRSYTRGGW
jgi:hypothetical protein